MFASDVKSSVMIGDVEVVIRKLSARSLDKARQVRQVTNAEQIRAFGGDVLKALRDENVTAAAESLAAKKADPAQARQVVYDAHDRDLVLQAGIVSWNAPRKLSADAIADLDETAAKTIFEAILDLSIPPAEAVEVKEGNA